MAERTVSLTQGTADNALDGHRQSSGDDVRDWVVIAAIVFGSSALMWALILV
jgi:hypothetical protein